MSLSISCPNCGGDADAALTVADGGEPPATDDLRGEEVTCGGCEAAFEVLFYPV